MGEFAGAAGLPSKAFTTCRLWFGRLPGGMAMATTGACAAFAAASGSAIATTASMGRLCLDEMRKYDIAPPLAAGSVACAGTLAVMIPPSGIMVIFAILTEQSVGQLLIGGIFPGLLEALLYMSVILFLCLIHPQLAPRYEEQVSWRARFASLRGLLGIGVLALIVILGIYTGIVTVNEAAALAAVAGFIIFVVSKWRSGSQIVLHETKRSLIQAGRVSCMIFTILFGGFVLSTFLSYVGLPFILSDWVASLQIPPIAIILVLMLIYVILGMFLDPIGMLVLTVPFLWPTLLGLGFHPIWLGVLIATQVELGGITPPIGLSLFIVKQIAPDDISLGTIIRGVIPFILADIIRIMILILFPALALWLPSKMIGG
jgi:tripartite ATP-independent transporter DctM subunit